MSKYIFKTSPRDYQKKAIKFLIDNKGVGALLCDPGCLSGYTMIPINRGGKGFSIPLKKLVHKLEGGGPWPWDLSIPTRIQRAEEGVVRLGTIKNVWFSGIKETYTLTTHSGKKIRATLEHPFLTPEGFIRLENLCIGDKVLVNGGKTSRGRFKLQYKDRYTKFHPRQRKMSPQEGRTQRYRVPEHRLVMEAEINNLDLESYMYILNNHEHIAKEFITYLTPDQVVHHKDHNHLNNHPSNLEIISHKDHAKNHSIKTMNNVLDQVEEEYITSIEYFGEEETYDIEVTDNPHNFIANDFVVHNTGKTKIVIDYLGIMTAKRGYLKVLVSAPLSALDTWQTQIDLHLGTHGGKEIPNRVMILDSGSILDKAKIIKDLDEFDGLTLVVINHDVFKYRHKVPGLRTVTVRDRMIDAVTKHWQPDVQVVDEMHRLKTHNSNLSSAFKMLGRGSFQRIGMTGTAAPHSPLDFFGQWQFINPQRFPAKWADFTSYYAIWGGYEGRELKGFYEDRLGDMKQRVAEDSFIVKKHEVLDLPKVTDIRVRVDLTTEVPYYLKMGKDLLVDLPSGGQSISSNVLTKMLRLRQITGGFVGYRKIEGVDEDGTPKEVTYIEDIGDTKLKYLMDKVEAIHYSGKKQVIYAHFRNDIKKIEKECRKRFSNTPVFKIDGTVRNKSRQIQREAFRDHDGPAIFIAQMRTVSLAINELVAASYGHFYSYSQQRDDFIQARDRLDRSGQTEPVTFYHYIVPHSIDEVILEFHITRTKLEAEVTRRGKEILTLSNME